MRHKEAFRSTPLSVFIVTSTPKQINAMCELCIFSQARGSLAARALSNSTLSEAVTNDWSKGFTNLILRSPAIIIQLHIN